jgi:16S rRNA processing protein RimM
LAENLPQNQSWKTIGKVKEAHGLKGELYILVFSGETSWLKKLQQFKLNETIYESENAKVFKQGLILKPRSINDRNQSEALKGQVFSIPADLLVSKKGETIYLSEILGFQVFESGQIKGQVVGTYMNGGHDLITLKLVEDLAPGGRTVDIPFVASYIEKIHWEEKKISMNLPEGLIELQLETSE